MNAKMLIAALGVVATGAAFAQQTEHVPADEGFVSTKTRAEVVAELKAAQQQGTYVAGGVAAFDPAVYIGTTGRSDTALAEKASGKTIR